MAAPDAASAPKIIPFAALEAGDADACAAVVEAWKAGVACVVRLADRAVLRGLWKGSAAGLATADTWPLERLGGLEVGHRQHGARDFLETRAICDEVRPPLGDGVRCAFDHLERCARAALKAACGPLGAAPETLLNLLDEPGRPKLSASVLRLCRYVAPAGEPRKRVCFGAHTDTTFCTVAPCAATPGLEVLDHGTWTSPERGRDSGTDVLVFCGEFLQVLSKSFYEAAVHRVALTAGAAESVRYSAPFLLRARRDATIVPIAAVAGGPPPRLLDLPGLSMAKFHRFLELRRRKLVQEHAQSNDDSDDPVFNYATKAALELWEMAWDEFTATPSRMSAEPVERDERERLLRRVAADGFVDDYAGVRVSSKGTRFEIRDAYVWNVYEVDAYVGQAALFRRSDVKFL